MNGTYLEAAELAASIAESANNYPDIDVALFPPYTALHIVHDAIHSTRIALGAQDVFWIESGAFTGQVSAPMLKDAGCSYCIVGHSEKRGRFGVTTIERELSDYFSDTDSTIRLKIAALVRAGLRPLLCVGESQYERSAGETASVVFQQVSAAIDGLEIADVQTVDIAYEPIWAIGTGNVCDPEEANRVCGTIREMIADLFSASCADSMRILYGGSVKADNSKALLSQPDIDGVLVGGASLIADEFIKIMENAQ